MMGMQGMPGMMGMGGMSGMMGMPGMAMGGMPGMMRPMMPMMGMPGMMMPGMRGMMMPGLQAQGTAAAVAGKSQSSEEKPDFLNLQFREKEPPIDPEVKAFLAKHEIDDITLLKRLNEEIGKKRDKKDSILSKLDDLLDDMGDPAGYLEMKLEDIANGDFIGKTLEVPEVDALVAEWNLTHEAKMKLNQMISNRGTKKGQDIVRLEKILEHSQQKSETVISLAQQLLEDKLEDLPDMGEADDVMKKFKLDDEAKRKLVQVVLQRAADSSRVLGRLEAYLESARKPSDAVRTLFGRLMAGGDVPEEHREKEDRRASDRDTRDRSRDRARPRERSRDRRSSRSRGRRSRSRRR